MIYFRIIMAILCSLWLAGGIWANIKGKAQ